MCNPSRLRRYLRSKFSLRVLFQQCRPFRDGVDRLVYRFPIQLHLIANRARHGGRHNVGLVSALLGCCKVHDKRPFSHYPILLTYMQTPSYPAAIAAAPTLSSDDIAILQPPIGAAPRRSCPAGITPSRYAVGVQAARDADGRRKQARTAGIHERLAEARE